MAQQVCRYIRADDFRLEPLRQCPRKAACPTPKIEHPVLGSESPKLDKVWEPHIEQLGAKAGVKCERMVGGGLRPICLHETTHFLSPRRGRDASDSTPPIPMPQWHLDSRAPLLTGILPRQQVARQRFPEFPAVHKQDLDRRPVVTDHFPIHAAGGDDVEEVWVVIRTAHRDDGVKCRCPFQDRFPNDDGFRTDRDASDIGFDMDGGEHRASGGAERRADAMLVPSVIGGDHLFGPVDEVAIITGERERSNSEILTYAGPES